MINATDSPSPWIDSIDESDPSIDASFVEYLRWMRPRSSDNALNSARVVDLLKQAENTDYSEALERLTERTKRLATDWFLAECPWRIRVGGFKGPESMLLPAFDALGMPYLPSSTLKGVARAIAQQEANKADETERSKILAQIAQVFGSIEPKTQVGQVVFLDAYPLPGTAGKGGLQPDMANAIWKWDGQQTPSYSPNPSLFLSLKKPSFVIGLRAIDSQRCPEALLTQAKRWLIQGLMLGIGSQVNSGYGELAPKANTLQLFPSEQRPKKSGLILKIPFTLEGQAIHGVQTVTWTDRQGELKPRFQGVSEVRPIAFRSALRYWFRAFALGVFSSKTVQELESEIFGGIIPDPVIGAFRVEITNVEETQSSFQSGTIILRHSPLTAQDPRKRATIDKLLTGLSWLMFHLGGVGQGARRPYYRRQNDNPSLRGVDLTPQRSQISPEVKRVDWQLPNSLAEFQLLFQKQLTQFYENLSRLAQKKLQSPRAVIAPSPIAWAEAIDRHCKIVAVRKLSNSDGKPYALSLLHQKFHAQYDSYNAARRQRDLPVEERNRLNQCYTEAKNLCGGVDKETVKKGFSVERDVTPSPIWISNLQRYQIVTVFGATQEPRSTYLADLKISLKEDEYLQLW